MSSANLTRLFASAVLALGAADQVLAQPGLQTPFAQPGQSQTQTPSQRGPSPSRQAPGGIPGIQNPYGKQMQFSQPGQNPMNPGQFRQTPNGMPPPPSKGQQSPFGQSSGQQGQPGGSPYAYIPAPAQFTPSQGQQGLQYSNLPQDLRAYQLPIGPFDNPVFGQQGQQGQQGAQRGQQGQQGQQGAQRGQQGARYGKNVISR